MRYVVPVYAYPQGGETGRLKHQVEKLLTTSDVVQQTLAGVGVTLAAHVVGEPFLDPVMAWAVPLYAYVEVAGPEQAANAKHQIAQLLATNNMVGWALAAAGLNPPRWVVGDPQYAPVPVVGAK